MKRLLSVMMVLALFLPMISCGEPVEALWARPEDATKAYSLALTARDDQTTDAEGRLLAEYRYEVPLMTPESGAPEAVLAVAETFNAAMQELLRSCVATGEQLGAWGREDPRVEGGVFYYSDHLSASWREQGAILCVTFQRYEERLGPHPDLTSFSYLFDLDRGCYVTPLALADDPEAFREAVEARILAEIREDPALEAGLFADYPEAVARWDEACVTLEETELAVTFSPYALAPHALGALTFRIPYEEAALGEGGLARLEA